MDIKSGDVAYLRDGTKMFVIEKDGELIVVGGNEWGELNTYMEECEKGDIRVIVKVVRPHTKCDLCHAIDNVNFGYKVIFNRNEEEIKKLREEVEKLEARIKELKGQ